MCVSYIVSVLQQELYPPTPVKPLQPMYDPLGNSLIKSSGFAILLYKLVRLTLDFKAAEAIAGADMVLRPIFNLKRIQQSSQSSITLETKTSRKSMIYDNYVVGQR